MVADMARRRKCCRPEVREKTTRKKMIEEEADAAAEGRAMLGVEVRLVQRDEAKEPSHVATQHGGAEDVILGKLLWQAEEEDEAAGDGVEGVQAGDKRVAHDVRRKLANMVSLHRGIS